MTRSLYQAGHLSRFGGHHEKFIWKCTHGAVADEDVARLFVAAGISETA